MKVGEILINSIKPFYVYEENNCLFIKNINEKIEKNIIKVNYNSQAYGNYQDEYRQNYKLFKL